MSSDLKTFYPSSTKYVFPQEAFVEPLFDTAMIPPQRRSTHPSVFITTRNYFSCLLQWFPFLFSLRSAIIHQQITNCDLNYDLFCAFRTLFFVGCRTMLDFGVCCFVAGFMKPQGPHRVFRNHHHHIWSVDLENWFIATLLC